jgi:hypothetical protein
MFALEIRLNGELKATCGIEGVDFIVGMIRPRTADGPA